MNLIVLIVVVSSDAPHPARVNQKTMMISKFRICFSVDFQVNHLSLQGWQFVDLQTATRVTVHLAKEVMSRQSGTNTVIGSG